MEGTAKQKELAKQELLTELNKNKQELQDKKITVEKKNELDRLARLDYQKKIKQIEQNAKYEDEKIKDEAKKRYRTCKRITVVRI